MNHTQTPEFKSWFDGSKVANEDGSPKVVYHGKYAPKGKPLAGDAFRTAEKENRFASDGGMSPDSLSGGNMLGSFFAENPEATDAYSDKLEDPGSHKPVSRHGRGVVIPVHLAIKNPLPLSGPGFQSIAKDMADSFKKSGNWDAAMAVLNAPPSGMSWIHRNIHAGTIRQYAQSRGYDGIKQDLIDGLGDNKGTEWIAFHPNQIKSAFNSHPTNDPRLLMSEPLEIKLAEPGTANTEWAQGVVNAFQEEVARMDRVMEEDKGLPQIVMEGYGQAKRFLSQQSNPSFWISRRGSRLSDMFDAAFGSAELALSEDKDDPLEGVAKAGLEPAAMDHQPEHVWIAPSGKSYAAPDHAHAANQVVRGAGIEPSEPTNPAMLLHSKGWIPATREWRGVKARVNGRPTSGQMNALKKLSKGMEDLLETSLTTPEGEEQLKGLGDLTRALDRHYPEYKPEDMRAALSEYLDCNSHYAIAHRERANHLVGLRRRLIALSEGDLDPLSSARVVQALYGGEVVGRDGQAHNLIDGTEWDITRTDLQGGGSREPVPSSALLNESSEGLMERFRRSFDATSDELSIKLAVMSDQEDDPSWEFGKLLSPGDVKALGNAVIHKGQDGGVYKLDKLNLSDIEPTEPSYRVERKVRNPAAFLKYREQILQHGVDSLEPVYTSPWNTDPKTGQKWVFLRNGHHRYSATDQLGIPAMPTWRELSPPGSRPNQEEAALLAEEATVPLYHGFQKTSSRVPDAGFGNDKHTLGKYELRMGPGAYFTSDPEVADGYARQVNQGDYQRKGKPNGPGQAINRVQVDPSKFHDFQAPLDPEIVKEVNRHIQSNMTDQEAFFNKRNGMVPNIRSYGGGEITPEVVSKYLVARHDSADHTDKAGILRDLSTFQSIMSKHGYIGFNSKKDLTHEYSQKPGDEWTVFDPESLKSLAATHHLSEADTGITLYALGTA